MSTKIDAELEEKLRQGFKYANKFMVGMWRLGFGPWFNLWPQGWGQIMVITHTGRVTGIKHHTPVNFAIIDGEVYCIAGFGKIADWYRNLLANPEVEIWLPDSWWTGTAEDLSKADNRTEIMRSVVVASGFAGPLFGVDPKALDDESLAEATKSYKVMRIRRVAARTGTGGPGDLAWVWQVATMVLLPLVFFRRKKR
jgi:deazaflavin-dependent oxidoreductase (nitroreductase family)